MMTLRMFRPVECVRLLLALFIGYTLRLITEQMNTSHSENKVCKIECPSSPRFDFLTSNVHTQLREPFTADSQLEVLSYDFFNTSVILTNQQPAISELLDHQKSDIKDVITQAMNFYNAEKATAWKLHNLLNGYRRFDPLRGEEFIFDLDLQLEPASEEDSIKREMRRIEIVKPFGAPHIVSNHILQLDKMVHLIVPVSAAVTERFQQFLINFEETCLVNEDMTQIYLLVVLFVGESTHDKQRTDLVQVMLKNLQRRYKHMKAHVHFKVVQTNRQFSRSLGIEIGTKQLPREALLFLCDVDVWFSKQFVSRCRENTIHNKRVYYPIMFAQYNPEIVKRYSQKPVTNLMDINQETGTWLTNSYSMACMYNADFRSVSGMDIRVNGVGHEDVSLYKKHVQSDLKIFRAMDSGLIHIYHDNAIESVATRDDPHSNNLKVLGSQEQLARKILQQN